MRIGVGRFPCVHVASDQIRVDRPVVGCERALFDGRPRAMQCALGSGHGYLERVGRLLRREPDDIAQEQHGALRGRKELQCGDERERYAFFQLDPRGRIARSVAQPGVGTGLDPCLFRRRNRRSVGIARRPSACGDGALRAAREFVDADVRPDAIEPTRAPPAGRRGTLFLARLEGASPAPCRPRRATSRACGSSEAAARRGAGQRAARTHDRSWARDQVSASHP